MRKAKFPEIQRDDRTTNEKEETGLKILSYQILVPPKKIYLFDFYFTLTFIFGKLLCYDYGSFGM
jgi:hypothetical protein